MNSIRRRTTFSFLSPRKRPFPAPRSNPILPVDKLIDEEICPGYDSKNFYPAQPGNVLASRYQIIVKVGWGSSSTVWFARDLRRYRWESESVVALKITNTNKGTAEDEHEIEERIAIADVSHRGFPLFRTYLERFEITGPEGRHLCLAYEPVREPLWIFKRHFKGGVIPLPIVKTYVRILLTGLDYLHTKCRVVHTDLKLENIMVSFEDPAVLDDFMNCQFEQPMECKIDDTGRFVYRSYNEFGPLRSLRNIPKIVDFGMSTKLDCDDDWGVYPIQPDAYRAPEVILGCGWRMSADIWNLGVLLWDLVENKELFHHIYDRGHYDPKRHLAEMIALLGPPPPNFISRAHSMTRYNWPEFIKREDGKVCKNAEQYFGGPFFDENGEFLHNDLVSSRTLANMVPSLEEKEKEKFLSLVKMMLTWIPEERKLASELIGHPFLQLK